MGMFYNYENINEMDIINFDMPNLKYADYIPIYHLLTGCNIKKKRGNIKKKNLIKFLKVEYLKI